MMVSFNANENKAPLLVVVMGVAGSGKTSLGQALAQARRWCYLDADDFHSLESRNQMAAGKPLTDAMRTPWIAAICQRLRQLAEDNVNTVLAFSGLKKAHREPLRHCGFKVLFLHLTGDREILAQRLSARTNHFMPASLLNSQLESLESPEGEPDVHPLTLGPPLHELLEQARELIDQHTR